jgi:hypothetical protein
MSESSSIKVGDEFPLEVAYEEVVEGKDAAQIPKTLPDLEYEDLVEEQAAAALALEAEERAAASIPESFLDLDYDPFEEERQFTFASLDEAQQAVAKCVTQERGSQWKLGAVVASAIDVFGPYGTYKKLASVCFYTTRRLKTFEELHRTFPPEVRRSDQPLLLYENALEAADPLVAVEEALEKRWSPRQLSDEIAGEKGEKVSRVRLFKGKAFVSANGPDWQIHVEAGRDWPDGNGVHQCYVEVRQIIKEDAEME